MTTVFIFSLIFSTADIGRPVPFDVMCFDAKTNVAVPPGAYLDAQEALAVVSMADTYERGCANKTLSLAAARDAQESSAVAAAATSGAAGGFASGAGLLAFLRRKKGPIAKGPPLVAS